MVIKWIFLKSIKIAICFYIFFFENDFMAEPIIVFSFSVLASEFVQETTIKRIWFCIRYGEMNPKKNARKMRRRKMH